MCGNGWYFEIRHQEQSDDQHDWCCFDNFKLTYLDAETGIQGVLGDKKEGKTSPIYRLDGVKVGKKPAQVSISRVVRNI